MAVTLTQAELSAALRLGSTAEENAETTRLLAYATEAISRHLGEAYADTPEVIVNESAIRLCAYLYDQPNAGRGISFANAGRNSGAWSILLPYKVIRAGSVEKAASAAVQSGSAVQLRTAWEADAADFTASSFSALQDNGAAVISPDPSANGLWAFWLADSVADPAFAVIGAASTTLAVLTETDLEIDGIAGRYWRPFVPQGFSAFVDAKFYLLFTGTSNA